MERKPVLGVLHPPLYKKCRSSLLLIIMILSLPFQNNIAVMVMMMMFSLVGLPVQNAASLSYMFDAFDCLIESN